MSKDNIEKYKWPKGFAPNPSGRPKGSLNRKTIVKRWLESEETIKNPITGEKEKLTQADIMTLALIKKARSGDVQAFKELMDSAFGKIKDELEQTVSFNDTEDIKKAFLESLKINDPAE
jgi:hypothetical protein